jgi:transposase
LIVLSRVERGTMTPREAARILSLSLRQIKRILVAYRKKGAAALAHGNRGESPGIPWMRE